MNQESEYKAIHFGLLILGIATLGALSPWLKSFGSTMYVLVSIAHLIALAFVARPIARFFIDQASKQP